MTLTELSGSKILPSLLILHFNWWHSVYIIRRTICESKINGGILKVRQLQTLYIEETTKIGLENQADKRSPGSAWNLFSDLRQVMECSLA